MVDAERSKELEQLWRANLQDTDLLKAVGFWNGDSEERFVDPALLVDEEWEQENMDKIIAYLKGFKRINHQMGFSYCRFGCNGGSRFDPNMGTSEQTDGIWIWPEGLVHYVEDHNIRLPSEFIDTMKRNDFAVVHDVGNGMIDYGFWIDWCNKVKGLDKMGWMSKSDLSFNPNMNNN